MKSHCILLRRPVIFNLDPALRHSYPAQQYYGTTMNPSALEWSTTSMISLDLLHSAKV